MDHDITRLIMAILLSGLVLFAWHYYRSAFSDTPSGLTTTVHQEEKVDIQRTDSRKDLSRYNNCGPLKIVVYPQYRALEYINNKTKNTGIALILFTLVIRLLLTPIMIKQAKSSKSMAGMKGEIENIKIKHKDDPLEMQKAIGAMFKEKGINPLSSIVLTIIQIPIFFALYKIVREAHLFSGAPLGLWINDLGVADPYYVLPVLSGLAMFFQTKLTGNTAAQMPGWFSYLLPLMFTVFLLNQPSGLALYMLVGSVVQLGITIVAYR